MESMFTYCWISLKSKDNVKQFADDGGDTGEVHCISCVDICIVAHVECAEGKGIGIVNGDSEHGPRALGNRSILCNPVGDMKDVLNAKVKNREWYRPFAPVVRLEDVQKYFDFPEGCESRHMTFVAKVHHEYRDVIPAVTHEDGTGRLQTVTEHQNALLYQILTAFDNISEHGVLMNTSFNVNGQPILSSLEDAFHVLHNTKLDGVYYDGNLYFKRVPNVVQTVAGEDNDSVKTIVNTIVTGGEKRVAEVNKMAATMAEFHPNYDLVVYADEHYPDLNVPEVVLISDVLPDVKVYMNMAAGAFNYNLKGLVTAHTYKTRPEYNRVIWCDCDVYFKKKSDILESWCTDDLYGRVGWFPVGVPGSQSVEKMYALLNDMDIMVSEKSIIDMPYINEVLIVFMRSEEMDVLMHNWVSIINRSYKLELMAAFESVELGLAYHLTRAVHITDYKETGIPKEDAIFYEHRDSEHILCP